jgi:hypothetical protein
VQPLEPGRVRELPQPPANARQWFPQRAFLALRWRDQSKPSAQPKKLNHKGHEGTRRTRANSRAGSLQSGFLIQQIISANQNSAN